MSHTHDQCQAIEGHFLSRITLRGVDLTIDSLTGYRVTAAAGAGQSILQNNAASADGLALTTPIVTRRITEGSLIDLVSAADSITVNSSIVGARVTVNPWNPASNADELHPLVNLITTGIANFTLGANTLTVTRAGLYHISYDTTMEVIPSLFDFTGNGGIQFAVATGVTDVYAYGPADNTDGVFVPPRISTISFSRMFSLGAGDTIVLRSITTTFTGPPPAVRSGTLKVVGFLA